MCVRHVERVTAKNQPSHLALGHMCTGLVTMFVIHWVSPLITQKEKYTHEKRERDSDREVALSSCASFFKFFLYVLRYT